MANRTVTPLHFYLNGCKSIDGFRHVAAHGAINFCICEDFLKNNILCNHNFYGNEFFYNSQYA